MTASIIYTGNLRCEVTHTQSGTEIETDAPTDNKGKGEKFSPTDILCVSLATCMLTTMAIKANDKQIDLTKSTADVTKHMLGAPRRVGKIEVSIQLHGNYNEDEKQFLKESGDNCPVMKSIHPDIEVIATYQWN